MNHEEPESAAWATLGAAAELAKRNQKTILRWAAAGYVRRMVGRGRVLVRKSDVTETEQAIFNGEQPITR